MNPLHRARLLMGRVKTGAADSGTCLGSRRQAAFNPESSPFFLLMGFCLLFYNRKSLGKTVCGLIQGLL